jgi:hypothetical protein
VRDDHVGKEPVIPWEKVPLCRIAELAPYPVSMRKIAEEFPGSLLEQIVADPDAQNDHVPQIGFFF